MWTNLLIDVFLDVTATYPFFFFLFFKGHSAVFSYFLSKAEISKRLTPEFVRSKSLPNAKVKNNYRISSFPVPVNSTNHNSFESVVSC